MKRLTRSLQRRLEDAIGNRADAWLATVFIDYEGQLDFDGPEWSEIWHDDTLTVFRNAITRELAGGFVYRKPLTAEQKVWL